MTERTIPIKILGHWQEARVQTSGGDLFIDIPAELIQAVEADHAAGYGASYGYQLMLEWRRLRGLLPERPRLEGGVEVGQVGLDIAGASAARYERVLQEIIDLVPSYAQARQIADERGAEVANALTLGAWRAAAVAGRALAASSERAGDAPIGSEPAGIEPGDLAPKEELAWVTYWPWLAHPPIWLFSRWTFCRLGVHLFDQVESLNRRSLYCDACRRSTCLRPTLAPKADFKRRPKQ